MEDKKKKNTPAIFFMLISIVLAVALCIVLCLYFGKNNETLEVMSRNQQLENEISNDMISIDTFKAKAQQYNVSVQFLQSFFDDVIVYKGYNGITYAPIDNNLQKNEYDFSNITDVGKEKQYIENGNVKSIKGIDVSTYQGKIDWDKVKADGVEYAILRVGYRGYKTGKILTDDRFYENIRNATNAGVKVGVYFYSQAVSVDEAKEEAKFVIDSIRGYKLDYPIVFDMEEVSQSEYRTKGLTQSERTAITKAFCDTILQYGEKPMVYGNIKWFMEQVDMSELEEYDKWFAQYFNLPFFPYQLSMWQYTGKGKVDGINHDVDLNICFKSY